MQVATRCSRRLVSGPTCSGVAPDGLQKKQNEPDTEHRCLSVRSVVEELKRVRPAGPEMPKVLESATQSPHWADRHREAQQIQVSAALANMEQTAEDFSLLRRTYFFGREELGGTNSA